MTLWCFLDSAHLPSPDKQQGLKHSVNDSCHATGLCNVMLSNPRLCWSSLTSLRAGSDTEQTTAQHIMVWVNLSRQGWGCSWCKMKKPQVCAGSSSHQVCGAECCCPGGSGTQQCHLFPSGHSSLESEGLYRVLLPTSTIPQHQWSLGIMALPLEVLLVTSAA